MLMADMEFSQDHMIMLPNGWDKAYIGRDMAGRRMLPHSYDGTGRILTWYTDTSMNCGKACDVEYSLRDVSLIADLVDCQLEAFLPRWVCTEVVAKLFKTPVWKWLKQNGLVEILPRERTYWHWTENGTLVKGVYIRQDHLELHMAFGKIALENDPQACMRNYENDFV